MRVIDVSAQAACRLVDQGDVVVVDVRSRAEFVSGHIPGARLLPADLIASGLATLDPAGPPILLCSAHGIRSAQAAALLSSAGFPRVLHMVEGMTEWPGPLVTADAELAGPSEWLLDHAEVLRGADRILDVACGRGRHALLLASAGFQVTAIDHDASAIAWLEQVASRCGWPVRTRRLDLETFPAPVLDSSSFDVILVFRYLFRPLFPSLARALAPGGWIVYETFLAEQANVGRPRNPRYLLTPGELAALLRAEGLEVTATREGERRGNYLAGAVARKR